MNKYKWPSLQISCDTNFSGTQLSECEYSEVFNFLLQSQMNESWF